MAAASYDESHLHAPQPLKPMLLADSISMNSGASGAKYDSLHHGGNSQDVLYQHHDEVLERMRFRDEKLKYRIRLLKLLARVLGLLLSLTTLSPLAVTLHKFLSTKDIFRTVDGQSRTAWNAETKLWPMYMYLALAAIATAFNLAIMLAYCWGVRHANRASTVAGWFSGGVYVGHVVVWAVGAALYRAGKDEGEHARDLWGWSCSLGAQKIQDAFAQEVNFGRYCNVQSFSWYSGLAQTGLGFLTAGVYFLAIVRMRSKKHVRKMSTLVEQRYEASRHS